jgi:hypothetical protein
LASETAGLTAAARSELQAAILRLTREFAATTRNEPPAIADSLFASGCLD